MKTENTTMTPIVHFGGGALGRGLVLDLLSASGRPIYLADANPALLAHLAANDNAFTIQKTDLEQPAVTIQLAGVYHPGQDAEKLDAILKEADTITTSVRRENLHHVASTLIRAWKDLSAKELAAKQVLCIENVEHVGDYFRSQLDSMLEKEEDQKKFANIRIPDTIVDRICSANPDTFEVLCEEFHECMVDENVVPDTGLDLIGSTLDIDSHFARKRYLLNTYADGISFLGAQKGLQYLHEAAADPKLNAIIGPYVELLKTYLNKTYQIDRDELDDWSTLYQKRLSNPKICRDLNTVARSGFNKLTETERFVYPLLSFETEEIAAALPTLRAVFEKSLKDENLTIEEGLQKLQKQWNSQKGQDLYALFSQAVLA